MTILEKLKNLVAEIEAGGQEEPPPAFEVGPRWGSVLNAVDWLQFVRDVKGYDGGSGITFWTEFCASVSDALAGLDVSASASLTTTVRGLAMWFRECAIQDDTHKDVRWGPWLDAVEAYLIKEDTEPGEYAGTTFAEFCEALASTMQSVLGKSGLHTWVSPAQETPRIPINAQKVSWFIAMLLWRVPEWLGEGKKAGEMTPVERTGSWTGGGDSPWSTPGA